jgi:hypothetical protein
MYINHPYVLSKVDPQKLRFIAQIHRFPNVLTHHYILLESDVDLPSLIGHPQ